MQRSPSAACWLVASLSACESLFVSLRPHALQPREQTSPQPLVSSASLGLAASRTRTQACTVLLCSPHVAKKAMFVNGLFRRATERIKRRSITPNNGTLATLTRTLIMAGCHAAPRQDAEAALSRHSARHRGVRRAHAMCTERVSEAWTSDCESMGQRMASSHS